MRWEFAGQFKCEWFSVGFKSRWTESAHRFQMTRYMYRLTGVRRK